MTGSVPPDDDPGRAVLPDGVARLLDGDGLAGKVGRTAQLIVNGSDGVPRLALLSIGEVVAVAPDRLAIALYASSRTSRALREQGQALLFVVVPGIACKVRLRVRSVVEPTEGGRLVRFLTEVVGVRDDAVSYADVTDGVRYVLDDPEVTVARWTATVADLRRLAAEATPR